MTRRRRVEDRQVETIRLVGHQARDTVEKRRFLHPRHRSGHLELLERARRRAAGKELLRTRAHPIDVAPRLVRGRTTGFEQGRFQ